MTNGAWKQRTILESKWSGHTEKGYQEDGADFISDAIFTGIMLGDNVLKDYVYKSETMDDMLAISKNEDNVANIFRIIENCDVKAK